MDYILLWIWAMSIRFFLFDFILFKRVRSYLNGFYIFKKLLKCPFCQGFWCFVLVYGISDFKIGNSTVFLMGISSGFLSLTWYNIVMPLIIKFEEGSSDE